MEKTKIKWGIMGLGKIAHIFASDLQKSENAVLHGVASREKRKAETFAKKYNTVKSFGSYEELATDPDINIVYIATPHAFHFENTMMCLSHGKAVLCEKPLGLNYHQVKKMVEKAKANKLFLMEAIWTRFIPATEKLLELLQSNAIEDLLFMHADFGFKADMNPAGRLFNKNLGGGSMMDIGIYPVFLSLLTFGIPAKIKAMARKTETGVDSYCAMLFDYDNSAKAMLESTVEVNTPTEAIIYGKKGYIKIHSPFHHSQKISVFHNEILKQEYELPYQGHGYIFEIEEVNRCLLNNQTESDSMQHRMSLNLITILDWVKKEIGLEYP